MFKSRLSCQQCGEVFTDTSVFARLNHKCQPIEPEPEPEPEPEFKQPKPRQKKEKFECPQCHKMFVNVFKHIMKCKTFKNK